MIRFPTPQKILTSRYEKTGVMEIWPQPKQCIFKCKSLHRFYHRVVSLYDPWKNLEKFPASMKNLPADTTEKSVQQSSISLFGEYSEIWHCYPKNPWDVMGCQVAIWFEAPGFSLGGSGVSTEGVRILRVVYNSVQNDEILTENWIFQWFTWTTEK